MRCITTSLVWLALFSPLTAAEAPLVEKYLHSGQLARGEQVMEAALSSTPVNDELRLSLAVVQLVRGVERLGQALYEYGCLPEQQDRPLLRIPVPRNPDPTPVTYSAFRRVLDAFRSDLATVESTLAGVKAEDVKLPLKLAGIRVDLTGKGDARERFDEILIRLLGPGFHLAADNPEFLVCLDRGDVAWLRAYCHLLMALIDLNLAFDLEPEFHLTADRLFANPKRRFEGTPEEKRKAEDEVWQFYKIVEPARLSRFGRHFVEVCKLNRETWKFIRAETDNDHEWLPNPDQTGVLRMPVTNQMIDSWLSMVEEVERLFEGERVIPASVIQFLFAQTKTGKTGLNYRTFLDDPPDEIDRRRVQKNGVRDKYLDGSHRDLDLSSFLRVMTTFQDTLAVGYAAWFN